MQGWCTPEDYTAAPPSYSDFALLDEITAAAALLSHSYQDHFSHQDLEEWLDGTGKSRVIQPGKPRQVVYHALGVSEATIFSRFVLTTLKHGAQVIVPPPPS